MRKRIAGVLAACAVSVGSAADAADIPKPVTKAPAATVGVNWTGFYLNAGGGYGMWAAESHTSGGFISAITGTPIPVDGIDKTVGGSGALARVGGGYDHQFTSRIVAGVFADFDFSDLKGTVHDAVVGLSGEIMQKYAWAAGARAGWLVTPELLTYANVGYTSARFSSADMVAYSPGGPTAVGAPSGYVAQPFTATGWFLGGGAEVSMGQGLFWRTEYRVSYFDDEPIQDINVFSANPTPRFNDINFKPTVQSFTTQLVYKFNPGNHPTAYVQPAAVIAANWSGLYASAGVGYGIWNADVTSANAPGGLPTSVFAVEQQSAGKGWLGRVGVGYDRQVMPRTVLGVFADFDASSLKGNIEDTLVAGDIRQRWAWAAGARAGWLLTPAVLGYVNGGYTQARFSSADMTVPGCLCLPFSGTSTPAFTVDGWFAGGGIEYAVTLFGQGLFWRNEYRYAQYDTVTLSDSIPDTGSILNDISAKPAVQTVTSQLVYKFGGKP